MTLSRPVRLSLQITAFLLTLVVPSVVSLWPYFKQSNKSLQYRVLAVSPLGPTQATGFKNLKLYRGDKPIERPYLVSLKIVNSGSVAIQANDFASPLLVKISKSPFERFDVGVDKSTKYPWPIDFKSLDFSSHARFVDVRIVGSSPRNISPDLVVTPETIQMAPLLLNPDDLIVIEALTAEGAPRISVEGRIVGIRAVEEEVINDGKQKIVGWLDLLVALVCVITAAGIWSSHDRLKAPKRGLPLIARPTSAKLLIGACALAAGIESSAARHELEISIVIVIVIMALALILAMMFFSSMDKSEPKV